jgi:N-acetylglucosamine-6-sulfatase
LRRGTAGPGTNRRSSAKAVFLVVGMLLFGMLSTTSSLPLQAQETARPNILFILTDDQDPDSLGRMDKRQNRLLKEGVRFPHAFVTTPSCCPSRATFLRGQYAHNHGILTENPPKGGWKRFRSTGREHSTVATWLNAAGYTTGLMGKYLNGYGDRHATTYVPPGCDMW